MPNVLLLLLPLPLLLRPLLWSTLGNLQLLPLDGIANGSKPLAVPHRFQWPKAKTPKAVVVVLLLRNIIVSIMY